MIIFPVNKIYGWQNKDEVDDALPSFSILHKVFGPAGLSWFKSPSLYVEVYCYWSSSISTTEIDIVGPIKLSCREEGIDYLSYT